MDNKEVIEKEKKKEVSLGKTSLNSEVEFEAPTWDQIYGMLLCLADKIRRDYSRADLLVGISRGGWIPARIISDLLEKPQLANIGVKFYSGIAETKAKPVITQPLSVSGRGKHILVIDDVADTGQSLGLVTNNLKSQDARSVRTATIYYKPWSEVVPHYYEKETKCWIIFPWERKEAVRNIVTKHLEEKRGIEEIMAKFISIGFDSNLIDRFIREIIGDLELRNK